MKANAKAGVKAKANIGAKAKAKPGVKATRKAGAGIAPLSCFAACYLFSQ